MSDLREYREIDQLKNWEQNPRIITKESFARLKKQIQELGEYKPLIVTKDGVVLGGNMRLKAYRELGFEKCWVSVINAETEEIKLKYALSDNDRAGKYDTGALISLVDNFEGLDLKDYKINLSNSLKIDGLFFSEEAKHKAMEEKGAPLSGDFGEECHLGKWITCLKCKKRHYIR